MNKNSDNFKKAMNNIHASEELKKKTLEKMKKEKKNNVIWLKFLTACAMVVVVFSGGVFFYKESNINENPIENKNNNIAKIEDEDMPRFESLEQLKTVLAKGSNSRTKGGMIYDLAESTMEATESATNNEKSEKQSADDYSTTNTQVENVDEADIVKTDGKYIYYTTRNILYIVESENLDIVSKLEFKENDNEYFNVQEIFLNNDKLVLLGNYFKYETEKEESKLRDYSYIRSETMAQAIVYNIKDKENPKEERQVALDGYYKDARMIEDNVYFISNKPVYYYDGMKDDDVLPLLRDTAITEDTIKVEPTDIAYFKNSDNHSYMMCAGFNINNDEAAYTDTVYGASDTIYASEKNLYACYTKYDYTFGIGNVKTTIFKFALEDSKITLKCKAKIDGDLNNQFSMDEYEGNLRVATTAYNGITSEEVNRLYILDENLEKIGKIDEYAKGESIYSVRFVGKIGYVVTFEQIDPLFVMDLSDPTNPQIKGELKIPGYSSYLHPYDETHIIGIGYNTKSNGYGGVTNANMKMSMFDVSDLENPKEMFSIDIGENYAYSEVLSNHKCLFYKKSENLIGFPVTYRENYSRNDRNSFTIFSIDLENGFEKYGEISQKIDYRTNIDRAIYIKDVLYTLSETKMVSYDLNTMEQKNELVLATIDDDDYIIE